MSEPIESYKLGNIEVRITPSESDKYQVHCTDGEYEITFKATDDEYKNYRKLMNRRIKREFEDINKEA